MDDVHDTGHPTVYHEAETDTSPYGLAALRESWAESPPRLFALVREDWDEGDQVIPEIVAYGIALPNGSAATFGANRTSFGRWRSAERASGAFHSELVWLASAQ